MNDMHCFFFLTRVARKSGGLAGRFDEHRDNLRNSQSVFLIVVAGKMNDMKKVGYS